MPHSNPLPLVPIFGKSTTGSARGQALMGCWGNGSEENDATMDIVDGILEKLGYGALRYVRRGSLNATAGMMRLTV